MPAISLLHPGPSTPPPATLPHVLLIVDQLPHRLGGGERIVLRQAEHLPAFGFRASILTFAAHPQSPALHNPPCPVYLLPLTRTWDLRALRGALALRRFVRRQRIRLVETFFESSDIWGGAVTRLLSPTRLVWNRRDMGILRSPKHFAAYHRLRNLPDHVIAVSDEVRRYTLATDGVPGDRVSVIPNGLDLAPWQHLAYNPPPPDRPHLVTLGNLRRIKGHDTLLHAFAQILREFPHATLTIGGGTLEPDFLAELHRIAAEHSLTVSTAPGPNAADPEATVSIPNTAHPDTTASIPNAADPDALSSAQATLGITPGPTPNVFLPGSIDGLAAQQALLSNATLFVLPSRSEGFSNAIIEAMAAGLPVVATRVGGNPEAVLTTASASVTLSDTELAALTPLTRSKEANPAPSPTGHQGSGAKSISEHKVTDISRAASSTEETGLLVPPDDIPALTEALLTLLRDPARLTRMSTNARTRVATLFTTEAMLRSTTTIFTRLLTSAAQPE